MREREEGGREEERERERKEEGKGVCHPYVCLVDAGKIFMAYVVLISPELFRQAQVQPYL